MNRYDSWSEKKKQDYFCQFFDDWTEEEKEEYLSQFLEKKVSVKKKVFNRIILPLIHAVMIGASVFLMLTGIIEIFMGHYSSGIRSFFVGAFGFFNLTFYDWVKRGGLQ